MTATLIGTPDPDARRPGWTATNTEGHVRVYEDGRISTPQTRARAWDRLPAPPPDEIW